MRFIKRKIFVSITCLVVFSLYPKNLHALEQIWLKNGRMIKGELIEKGENELKLKLKDGSIFVVKYDRMRGNGGKYRSKASLKKVSVKQRVGNRHKDVGHPTEASFKKPSIKERLGNKSKDKDIKKGPVYKKGKLNLHYDEEGKVKQTFEGKIGKNGVFKEFYPNGKVKRLATYERGKLDGLSQEFRETGVLISEKFYSKGRVYREKRFNIHGHVTYDSKKLRRK